MDDRFFSACFPASVRVCGRELTAFSSYHVLCLSAVGSPFLRGDGRVRPADLLVAVKVCRQRFTGDLSTPSLKPSLRDAWWVRRLTRNGRLFRRECEKFSAFIAAQSSIPKFWQVITGGEATRPLTGPSVLVSVAQLISRTTLTLDQAWNMSLGFAEWINAELNELDGSTKRFLDEEELKQEEVRHA